MPTASQSTVPGQTGPLEVTPIGIPAQSDDLVEGTPSERYSPMPSDLYQSESPDVSIVPITPLPNDMPELATPIENQGRDPSSSPDDSDSVCFPASATVTLEGGVQRLMQDVRIGDRVQVAHDVFSPVFMFTHKLHDVWHSFITIRAVDGSGTFAKLSLTKSHFLYVNGRLAEAGTVKPRDTVELASGKNAQVVTVKNTLLRGLYNPQTLHGDIVVDGIRATTYTRTIHTNTAHSLLTPLRLLFRVSGWSSSFLDSGVDRIANCVRTYSR